MTSPAKGSAGRKKRSRDEPLPDGEGWVEWGGELIWAVGYTEGGAPFGLTVDEFRAAIEREHPGAGWVGAKHVLRSVLPPWAGPGSSVDVGRVTKIGDGLSREIFAADVNVDGVPGRSGAYVVMLPRRDADAELDRRTRREARLLARLNASVWPLRVPEVVGAFPVSGRLALVRRYLDGVPLDLRAGRQPGVRPWQVVGEMAATIHSIGMAELADVLVGPMTRRAHAEATLAAFSGLEGPEVQDARLWAAEHLPPTEPAVLVHGDLLGQNILLWPGELPGVIDWEYAQRGDPAYDLAIVTRGVRRPFQIDRGLERLLDAYATAGGCAVSASQVHLHELCLAATWYREALAGAAEPPDSALARLRAILRRAIAGST